MLVRTPRLDARTLTPGAIFTEKPIPAPSPIRTLLNDMTPGTSRRSTMAMLSGEPGTPATPLQTAEPNATSSLVDPGIQLYADSTEPPIG